MKKYLENIFKNKKILILGIGTEGQSTLNFLGNFFPDLKVSTADKKDGNNYLDNLKDFNLVIKSPGISWNIQQIKDAKKLGIQFTSQTQIFLDLFKNQTIGITGTKGKSTTSALIYNILKTAGREVKLVGNIGKPVLDYIDDFDDKSLFVYEMSSHQLSNLATSPHIAVFLNIFPEHLDYYSSIQEYFQAKTNIARYQSPSDVFIYNSDFNYIQEFANTINSKKISFSSNDNLEDLEIKLDFNPLLGAHNLNNIVASVLVAKSFGLDNSVIKNGIESFKPLDDRLELVRKIGNVSFVNDGLATIPQATISAIGAFKESDLTLILGGYDRGINFEILGKYLINVNNVKNIILIGQTTGKIAKVLSKNKFKGKVFSLGKVSMEEIVQVAYEVTKPQGVVLLSPSASSFDMFKDYKDRGLQFKKAVEKL